MAAINWPSLGRGWDWRSKIAGNSKSAGRPDARPGWPHRLWQPIAAQFHGGKHLFQRSHRPEWTFALLTATAAVLIVGYHYIRPVRLIAHHHSRTHWRSRPDQAVADKSADPGAPVKAHDEPGDLPPSERRAIVAAETTASLGHGAVESPQTVRVDRPLEDSNAPSAPVGNPKSEPEDRRGDAPIDRAAVSNVNPLVAESKPARPDGIATPDAKKPNDGAGPALPANGAPAAGDVRQGKLDHRADGPALGSPAENPFGDLKDAPPERTDKKDPPLQKENVDPPTEKTDSKPSAPGPGPSSVDKLPEFPAGDTPAPAAKDEPKPEREGANPLSSPAIEPPPRTANLSDGKVDRGPAEPGRDKDASGDWSPKPKETAQETLPPLKETEPGKQSSPEKPAGGPNRATDADRPSAVDSPFAEPPKQKEPEKPSAAAGPAEPATPAQQKTALPPVGESLPPLGAAPDQSNSKANDLGPLPPSGESLPPAGTAAEKREPKTPELEPRPAGDERTKPDAGLKSDPPSKPAAAAAPPSEAKISFSHLPPEKAEGRSFVYKIVVRNNGDQPVKLVDVDEGVPAGHAVESTDPVAEARGGSLHWTLENVAPREERTLAVLLNPPAPPAPREAPRELRPAASIGNVDPAAASEPRTATPHVRFELLVPDSVHAGTTVRIGFRATNLGAKTSGLKLNLDLPPQLRAKRGQKLEYVIGELGENETREDYLTVVSADEGSVEISGALLSQRAPFSTATVKCRILPAEQANQPIWRTSASVPQGAAPGGCNCWP